MNTTQILHQLEQRLLTREFRESTDRYRVCRVAMGYLGLAYLRTEELAPASIDCSALTSQSHWEGALQTIPFIAEGQRLGVAGRPIDNIDDALPGDVLIKHASLSTSPNGQYNHVAPYLGEDESGCRWVIEAKGDKGVILTPAMDFAPKGGIRRYLPDTNDDFSSKASVSAIQLATKVPKLGRPEARQYLVNSDQRIPHSGTDIYVNPSTIVFAPISGIINPIHCDFENADGISIRSNNDRDISVTLLHVRLDRSIRSSVTAGERLGEVVPPKSHIVRYVDGLTTNCTHLHFEISSSKDEYGQLTAHLFKSGLYHFNGLLALKYGLCAPPLQG